MYRTASITEMVKELGWEALQDTEVAMHTRYHVRRSQNSGGVSRRVVKN